MKQKVFTDSFLLSDSAMNGDKFREIFLFRINELELIAIHLKGKLYFLLSFHLC